VLAYSDDDKKRVSSRKSSINMALMPRAIRKNITNHPLYQREEAIFRHGVQRFLSLKQSW